MNYSKGLEGVVAGETSISNVEGDIGRLSYRGYAIEELVEEDYEAVMYLVLFGERPASAERCQLEAFLARHGALDACDVALLKALPRALHPMRMLQAMIPAMSSGSVEAEALAGLSDEGARGLGLVARLPALIATWRRLELDERAPAHDEEADHLGNFLGMFTGEDVPPEHVDILRVVQILQMEHSFNASTFTARCVASTLAPVESVLSAAVGALHGILHGGADEAALNDAKKVGYPERAEAFIDDLLARKGKLMGMGHREYKIVDPRAVILRPLAERLCRGTPAGNTFETLAALENAMNARMREKGKDVWANLEFYKGAVYEAIGIPPHYFTSIFAMSRAVGWLAHFMESRQDNRIIRPKAAYVGAAPRSIADEGAG